MIIRNIYELSSYNEPSDGMHIEFAEPIDDESECA